MNPKSNVTRDPWWRSNKTGTIYRIGWRYHRHCRTYQEIRENEFLKWDEDAQDSRVRIPHGRLDRDLNNWNLEKLSTKNWKRSWKFYFKCRKQWGTNL